MRRLPPISLTLLIAVVVTGCNQRAKQDYTPSPERCRECLARALQGWQTGEVPGATVGAPQVQLADSQRKSGQRLIQFEILGEQPSEDGRRFSAHLKLGNPAAEETVSYVVLGIDPIWVIRLEDYELMTHWDHRMDPPAPPLSETPSVEAEDDKDH